MCITVVCEFRAKFWKRKLKEIGRLNVIKMRKLKLKVMLRKQEVDMPNGINCLRTETDGELLCEHQRNTRFHIEHVLCSLENGYLLLRKGTDP
jgi:hypothetical protein